MDGGDAVSLQSMARILAGGKGSAPIPEAVGTVVEGPSAGGAAPLVLVAIDGADDATPCESVTGVNAGDRVRVALSGGRAVVTGNLTSRATDAKAFARTLGDIPAAVNCIKQTEQGLVVGNTDGAGNFVGSRTLLGESLYFIGPDGTVLGEFSSEGIYIGGCEIAVQDEGEFQGMNIYSSLGSVYISARKFPLGTAGSSMRSTPPAINVTESAVSMSVGYVRTDETGVVGSGAHSITLSSDGISLNGAVRVNGKDIG